MDKKKLYGHWYIWEELVSYPMMLYYWIKGDKIQKMLSERIEKARRKAEQMTLTEKNKNEFLIEYEKLDNFQDKINYCLKQYRKESSQKLTSSNLMKLQGNFLAGAEKTLFLYFLLYRERKPNNSFVSIFSSEENYNKFIFVMKNNSYLDENNKFDISVIFISGVLTFLKKKGVIKNVKNINIIKLLKDDFDFEISPSSFSSGMPYPTKDEEKKLFDDLSKELMVKY